MLKGAKQKLWNIPSTSTEKGGGYHAYAQNPDCDVNQLVDIIGTLAGSVKDLFLRSV